MPTLLLPPPPIGIDADLLEKLARQHSPAQQIWLSGYLYGVALNQQTD